MHIDTGKTGEFRYEVSAINDQDEARPGITPSQTVGPYVHIGLTLEDSDKIADPAEEGAVEVAVQVIDGDGTPIADAMVEIWQARPDGTFNAPNDPRTGAAATVEGFRGLGRAMADETGTARFTTLLPGAFDGQAPHLNLSVFARGMLERLYTRLYFPEELEANAADPVLASVGESRRHLLVAEQTDAGYRLTVNVQHEDPASETPFFQL
ncbi:protocatechuate 3,4-dioxygenase subunit alpha [Corynebacterium guangdongense]|uniref:Protocatechuate 3,4-dioxygenase alpha subunit n=1 Tax=Corynebacterium guangdongense TaxID=1783348 RepID=A0ABU1ZYT4_9CORY|nr:protocatechuate 3,4-dioxygenase subunit alpha [Corynebacterium guangdongense]MDR7330081.1 protocatechuate 3,4-dioxygenase alpha subunit [Corynebacterium guangdongense]WJZ18639.1 Protocatechuate 3,4-dioxygenase alpha chain [Corynebacterium guangdongense]